MIDLATDSESEFQLTLEGFKSLTSQFTISNAEGNLSQFAIGSLKNRDPRRLPCAFTENGSLMAANVRGKTWNRALAEAGISVRLKP